MRQILLLPLAALLAMPVFSQTPADTTLTIRNIEIQGTRFAGLSERGGMKILRVDNNLSSVTNTAADAFRQLPSVITDMEGAVTYIRGTRLSMPTSPSGTALIGGNAPNEIWLKNRAGSWISTSPLYSSSKP